MGRRSVGVAMLGLVLWGLMAPEPFLAKLRQSNGNAVAMMGMEGWKSKDCQTRAKWFKETKRTGTPSFGNPTPPNYSNPVPPQRGRRHVQGRWVLAVNECRRMFGKFCSRGPSGLSEWLARQALYRLPQNPIQLKKIADEAPSDAWRDEATFRKVKAPPPTQRDVPGLVPRTILLNQAPPRSEKPAEDSSIPSK
ncbi:hypothetical protein AVEN_26042-1 [Araneus ventricosus]|uniref:Uncharacterized protein n=1 Tax=Araneus ventricosus TaxID=182803 RepID=A0A4Y2IM76_ARAVE|nr:hypothetical protein AVEN_258140-1 [Araneus ventricosus]GBM78941.1 hypothetical protein AVEN_26042-1 [Araneus ventricosus]